MTSNSPSGGAPAVIKMSREDTSTDNNITTTATTTASPEEDDKRTKSNFNERLSAFKDAIKEKIDFDRVKLLAFAGIPDSPGLRSVYWKILLGYLPSDYSLWKEVLAQKRKIYKEFCQVLCIDPRKAEPIDDHPLSTSANSQWHAFFKDKELIDEIDKDVKRTLPHLHFFNHDKSVGSTEHYEALKTILFIYGKLNPGIRYVQGMNEILGPIYYIFATDPEAEFKENAEADTFFCFTNLMAEIRDNFIKTLDKDVIGITGLISRLNKVLQAKDPELWKDFEDKGLNPQYYSFRWLTLLLSQEFDLPDVMRLWDSLFADPFRFQFLLYVCTAMLVCLREQLLDGGFADNLKMIQHYPLQDIRVILAKAEEIAKDDYISPPARPKPLQPLHHESPTGTKKSSAGQRFWLFSEDKSKSKSDDSAQPFPEDSTREVDTIHRGSMPIPPKPFTEDVEEPTSILEHAKAKDMISKLAVLNPEEGSPSNRVKTHPLA